MSKLNQKQIEKIGEGLNSHLIGINGISELVESLQEVQHEYTVMLCRDEDRVFPKSDCQLLDLHAIISILKSAGK